MPERKLMVVLKHEKRDNLIWIIGYYRTIVNIEPVPTLETENSCFILNTRNNILITPIIKN